MDDYIKINRKILDWEWYKNINTKVLFLHMLLKANWKEGKFEGKIIKRGSFVSSLPVLSDETTLTVREIRTAISHLKTTGELTVKTCNKYSIFTVVNYDLYQSSDRQNDSQVTDKRHSNDILTTAIEEKKEGKKGRSNTFIPPTLEEVKAYCLERKNSVDPEQFFEYYHIANWVDRDKKPVKNWKQKVISWEGRKQNTAIKKPGFNDFPQNKIDFEALEDEILSN